MGSTWGASPTFCISRCFGRLRFFIEGNLPYIIPKMSFSKNNKMLAHVGFRMKITMTDSRTFVGIFKAFDKNMNVILSDCEEFRRVRGKRGKEEKEEKRSMGLVLLRGETIVTMTLSVHDATCSSGWTSAQHAFKRTTRWWFTIRRNASSYGSWIPHGTSRGKPRSPRRSSILKMT